MEIIDLNPWWKNGQVEEEYLAAIKRPLLDEMFKFMESRQILSIVGLRRVGKTTLIHQIINYLLNKGIKKENIFYYNFDMGIIKISDLIQQFEEKIKIKTKEEKVYIFLDEIQKLAEWHNELKLIYDLNRNIKFVITGSASLFIEKKTKESLAGRTFSFQLSPITFKEFLLLKNLDTGKKLELWKKEINLLLPEYLKTGGFPEIISEQSDEKRKLYIKESVIDRLAYIDIPQIFKIEEPELLIKLLEIISASPGSILDFNKLSNDLKRDRKTIAAYMFYLEKAFLIKKFYNFSSNVLTNEKKAKKFYPASTAFAYFFNVEISKLVENSAAIHLDTKFFYRKQEKEVDFIKIKENKSLDAIEIKYKENIKKEDLSGLNHFFGRFSKKFSTNLILITKNEEKEISLEEGKKIKFIPLWKWLLE